MSMTLKLNRCGVPPQFPRICAPVEDLQRTAAAVIHGDRDRNEPRQRHIHHAEPCANQIRVASLHGHRARLPAVDCSGNADDSWARAICDVDHRQTAAIPRDSKSHNVCVVARDRHVERVDVEGRVDHGNRDGLAGLLTSQIWRALVVGRPGPKLA